MNAHMKSACSFSICCLFGIYLFVPLLGWGVVKTFNGGEWVACARFSTVICKHHYATHLWYTQRWRWRRMQFNRVPMYSVILRCSIWISRYLFFNPFDKFDVEAHTLTPSPSVAQSIRFLNIKPEQIIKNWRAHSKLVKKKSVLQLRCKIKTRNINWKKKKTLSMVRSARAWGAINRIIECNIVAKYKVRRKREDTIKEHATNTQMCTLKNIRKNALTLIPFFFCHSFSLFFVFYFNCSKFIVSGLAVVSLFLLWSKLCVCVCSSSPMRLSAWILSRKHLTGLFLSKKLLVCWSGMYSFVMLCWTQ